MPKKQNRRAKGEGGVSQRSNGTWQAYIHQGFTADGKPKRKWLYGATKEEVLQKKKTLEIAIIKNEYVEPTKTRLADWMDKWLENYVYGNVRQTTYEWYTTLANKHVKSEDIGKMYLEKITNDDVQSLFAKKIRAKYSSSTIHAIRAVLNSAMEQALINKMIVTNPTKGTRTPEMVREKDYCILGIDKTRDIVQKLMSNKDYPMAAIYITAVLTGMRQEELFGLHWDSVDCERGLIRVWRVVEQPKSGPLLREIPKTSSSRREITISNDVITALKHHKEIDGTTDKGLVFFDTQGGLLRKDNFRFRHWSKFKEYAGIPAEMGFHDLRHTHATQLLIKGVHPKVVSERMGHANIAFTMKTYQHWIPSMQSAIKDKLDTLLDESDE